MTFEDDMYREVLRSNMSNTKAKNFFKSIGMCFRKSRLEEYKVKQNAERS